MIIVSVAFVVCWFLISFYFIVVDNTAQASSDMFAGYYSTVFLAYFYICMNPVVFTLVLLKYPSLPADETFLPNIIRN